ncbi:MAG: O-antigen ligase family protein [Candidatus Omnitrophica bacterium]|nr:O-antigen ligase family protein [Candidatus Omnitrophota bacterium]
MQFATLLLYVIAILIRPQDWVGIMRGIPIVDMIVFVAVFFTFAALTKGSLKIPRVPENILMIGFLVATLMSHVAHTYFGGIIFTIDCMSKIVIFFFLVLIIVDSKRKIDILVSVIILAAVFMAINGMLQFYRGFGFVGDTPTIDTGIIRIRGYGIFHDPNDLALFFAVAFPFILMLIIRRRNLLELVFASISAVLVIGATWLTNSRSGFLALALAILVFFRRRLKGFKWIFFTAISVVLLLAFSPVRLTKSFFDQSSHERLMLWGYGNRMLRENPLFGVGYKMYASYAEWSAAHNSFINCYSELGLFGYFFWIALLYVAIIGLWNMNPQNNTRSTEENNEIMLTGDALLAGIVGYLVASMFLSRTYIIVLYLLIALSCKLRYIATDGTLFSGDLLERRHVRNIVAIEIVSVMFLYLTIKFMLSRY